MKLKYFLFLMIVLLFPFNVKAASISKVEVQGTNSSTVGNSFYQSFYVGVSGVQKGQSGLGIGAVVFKLDFDENVFTLTSMSKIDSFETKVYKEGSSYYIVSTIDETNSFHNKCVDNILYCADYLLTLQFYTKNTDKSSSNITMSEVNCVLFNTNSDYSESSATTISSGSTSTNTISIKQSSSVPTSSPSSISISSGSRNTSSATSKVSSKAKSGATSNSPTQTTTTQSSSSDSPKFTNYLSSLEVKGYEIKFDKEQSNYKVLIDKKVNKLEVNATAENEKSNVEIKGADNLKKNNYKVLIIVTSEDGYKRTYIIRAVEDVKDEKVKEKKSFINMNWIKKHKNYIIIGLGSIVFILLILFIIIKKKDRKLDKMFDNFDKFD